MITNSEIDCQYLQMRNRRIMNIILTVIMMILIIGLVVIWMLYIQPELSIEFDTKIVSRILAFIAIICALLSIILSRKKN